MEHRVIMHTLILTLSSQPQRWFKWSGRTNCDLRWGGRRRRRRRRGGDSPCLPSHWCHTGLIFFTSDWSLSIVLVQTAVDTPHVTRHCIELQGESRSCGGREGSEKSSDSGLLPSSPSSSPSSTPSRRASSLLPSSCSSSSAGGEPDLGNYCTLPRKGRQATSTSFHTVTCDFLI